MATNMPLGFVGKYELCKEHIIRSFNQTYMKTHSKEVALKKSYGVLKKYHKKIGLNNPRAIRGLRGELLFYCQTLDLFQPVPEQASGWHSDFRGIMGETPVAIDVTTNPEYKRFDKYQKVSGSVQSKWQYHLAVVEPNAPSVAVYPLLLPLCSDGNQGHYVLVLYAPHFGPHEVPYANGTLVRYNGHAKNVEDAIDAVISKFRIWPDYIVDRGKNNLAFRGEGLSEDKNEGHFPPPVGNFATNWVSGGKQVRKLVFGIRKIGGYAISAIVQLDRREEYQTYWEQLVNPKIEFVTKKIWVHPHRFIQKQFLITTPIMQHNIGSELAHAKRGDLSIF